MRVINEKKQRGEKVEYRVGLMVDGSEFHVIRTFDKSDAESHLASVIQDAKDRGIVAMASYTTTEVWTHPDGYDMITISKGDVVLAEGPLKAGADYEEVANAQRELLKGIAQ